MTDRICECIIKGKHLIPVNNRKWVMKKGDAAAVDSLQISGFSFPYSLLLPLRGIDDSSSADYFLNAGLSSISNPFLFKGMDKAAERVADAVEKGERICIYGDYDVDGVTATALLVTFLNDLSADVFYHIPHRTEDGYGLSLEGIHAVKTKGAQVIITVDCGITAVSEAILCREIGIDLIITDHHLPDTTLPDSAFSVIDQMQQGCTFPSKDIAGVGVAFYLAVALRKVLRGRGFFSEVQEPDIRNLLDFVALGTIADMAPVRGENRLLIKYGLKLITKSERPGLLSLKRFAGVTGDVSCGAVGFKLAPRINAAGRLEHAESAVELLLTRNQEKAQELASNLEAGNLERREVEKDILENALMMLKKTAGKKRGKSIVLSSPDWHPGVIGIVASKLVELYHRPVILISMQDGIGKGSCRSIPALHLRDALDACSEHLLKFGGHRQAAGLSVREDKLLQFIESFDSVLEGLLSEDDLLPEIYLDIEILPEYDLKAITDALSKISPFGIGNPEPLFLVRGGAITDIRPLKGGHIKYMLNWDGKRVEALHFGKSESIFSIGDVVDIAAHLDENEWRGSRSYQLRIKDIRTSGGEIF